MKKNLQKDLEVIKKPLTFAPTSMKITLHECESSKGGLMMKKNLSKRFGDLKNLPYLCTTFPLFGAGL